MWWKNGTKPGQILSVKVSSKGHVKTGTRGLESPMSFMRRSRRTQINHPTMAALCGILNEGCYFIEFFTIIHERQKLMNFSRLSSIK